MRFRVEHEALADAVAWVARALPTRPVVPVLSALKLEAADGLALSCFDYELAASAQLPADVAEPGTALVPGRLLAEIIRNLPAQPADFRSSNDEVLLSCGSAEFAVTSLPLDDYPAPPLPPPQAGSADGGELATAIAQVLPAASRDDTLPILTAVCLDIHGDLMTLAATDRYRMAVRQLRWQPAAPGLRAIALIPARTLADAARVMAPGVRVSLALPSDGDPAGRGGDRRPLAGMAEFASGGRRLTGRLIAGEYIRYESRFPAGFGCRAEVPAAPFTEALRRVSLVAERASPVRLTFGRGRVVIEAQAEGKARAVETVTASFHGDEPAIAFNPHYLLDGVAAAAAGRAPSAGAGRQEGQAAGPASSSEAQALASTELAEADRAGAEGAWVRLEFTSPAKPALITLAVPGQEADAPGGAQPGVWTGTPPAFRYLVVPLRRPARG